MESRSGRRTTFFERMLLKDTQEADRLTQSWKVLSEILPEDQANISYLRRQISQNDSEHADNTSKTHDFIEECRADARFIIRSDLSKGMPGMGGVYRMQGLSVEDCKFWMPSHLTKEHKIGELPSTAICGNDITASCFYMTGELAKNAGVYSPICTMLSSITLYCFRHVYGEVVTALPLNGGIYNLLLNSSTKRMASVAACLTILSYTATGVVSSVSAADYLQCSPFFEGVKVVPVAIGILSFFAMLMLLGMKESSVVASALFIFHLSILFILMVFSLFFLQEVGLGQLYENMNWKLQPSMCYSIFFGFSTAMLGVSGFETSANFVEEQKPGVFPKTLRNMWVCVSLINIVIPSLSICILPMDDLTGEKSGYAIAFLAERVGGAFLRDVVAVDALLVLSGSVLTSYVGVCGLFQRMAGDRCLPEFFAAMNSWRNTPHYTILVFFGVCASMCIVLDGNITLLSAIYSISFLLVMGLFAFCGLWMKVKRPTLPRQINTHPVTFLFGMLLVGSAFTAVVLLHPDVLTYFYIYYGSTTTMVMATFARVSLFTAFLRTLNNSKVAKMTVSQVVHFDVVQDWILRQLAKLKNQEVVYFTKSAHMSQINRALQYIEENEEARRVRVIHVHSHEDEIPMHLLEYIQLLDCVYPKIRIDCILVHGEFSPAIVHYIGKQLGIKINSMFINCPQHNFEHALASLGGVRVILNSEKGTLMDGVRFRRGDMSRRTSEALIGLSSEWSPSGLWPEE